MIISLSFLYVLPTYIFGFFFCFFYKNKKRVRLMVNKSDVDSTLNRLG